MKKSNKNVKPNKDQKGLMTFDEFCSRIGISASTGRRMIYAGNIGYVRIGKLIFVTEQQLEDFIERHTVEPV